MTFPRSEADLPHPLIAPLAKKDKGQGSGAVNDVAHACSQYSVSYDEGAKVGYKWYEAEHRQPLFPFGFGLSYTTFAYSDLKTSADRVTFTLRNTGTRAGVEIAQLYATPPASAGEFYHRLAGWQRVALAPGEAKTMTIMLDRRPLSIYDENSRALRLQPGVYRLEVGASSAALPLRAEQVLP